MDIAEYKRKAILAWHLFLSSSYRNTRKTRLYDPEYMGKISSFLPLDAKEPLWGYLKKSGNQLLKEGELLKKGWMQFPDPHPLFDTAYYLCRYFPQGLDENPYVHYLQKGWRKGLLPGPFLAENFALSRQQCPLLPIQENIEKTTNDWFSPSCYLAKNQTVEQIGDTLLVRHYKLYGSQEAKSPCLLFSPSHYLEQLEKEQRQRALADPLSHYICSLFLEKRDNATQPSPFFDPLFYCKRYNIPPTEKNICRYLSGREKSVRYSSKRSCEFKILPTFSILVPVYNPHLRQLDTCIRSVIYQTYPHWQLCLVDDGSTSMDVQNRLQFWAEQEPRINITFHHKNKGIAEATNTAAAMATGQFLGFLDNDDELSFHCLEEIAAALNRCPADMLYTDEALISTDGSTLSFFRKPAYNPRLLLSHNYITHFMVVRKDLFTQAGGCDPSRNGAQDYDIALKICERTSNITHIAKPLYHWRASENSTSINHDTKNYANENGKKALAAALKRQQINRCAENSELNFYYRITSATPPAAAQIFIWQPQDTQKSTSSKQKIVSENDNIIDIIYVTAPEKKKTADGLVKQAEKMLANKKLDTKMLENSGKHQMGTFVLMGETGSLVQMGPYDVDLVIKKNADGSYCFAYSEIIFGPMPFSLAVIFPKAELLLKEDGSCTLRSGEKGFVGFYSPSKGASLPVLPALLTNPADRTDIEKIKPYANYWAQSSTLNSEISSIAVKGSKLYVNAVCNWNLTTEELLSHLTIPDHIWRERKKDIEQGINDDDDDYEVYKGKTETQWKQMEEEKDKAFLRRMNMFKNVRSSSFASRGLYEFDGDKSKNSGVMHLKEKGSGE